MVTTEASPRTGSSRAIGVQLGILTAGLLAVGLAPPANGQVLLIPLTTSAATELPALALRDGTQLIGRGRLPGSLVVRGERNRLGWPMLMDGVVPIASARPGCGAIAA
jgi:hypothetical protein